MKTSFKTSLLALACAIGLTATPQAHSISATAAAKNAGAALVVYEIVSLLRMTKRGSKADFKQRALLDTSLSLLKKDATQWAKNALKNAEIVQTDYIEGQASKGQGLSVDPEGKVISSKKCAPAGFNGHLLGWFGAINKAKKSVADIALLVFTVKTLQSSKIKKYFGWEDPADKSKSDSEKQAEEAKNFKRSVRAHEKTAAAAERSAQANERAAAAAERSAQANEQMLSYYDYSEAITDAAAATIADAAAATAE